MQDLKPVKIKKVKQKRCKNCQSMFDIDERNPLVPCCSYDCKLEYAKLLLENKRKKDEKDERVQRRKEKEALKIQFGIKDKKTPEKKLEEEINLIVRLIDKGQPCIARGLTKAKWNAGHYISVGANKTIRYNLHNIHIQSVFSNKHKGGDTILYQKGIVKVYGQWYLDKLNSLHSTPPIKLSDFEMEEKTAIARRIAAKLKQADQMYSAEKRIELREQINSIIGIYKPLL